ncbi:MAG: hypothetical protein MUE51_12630 [Thermoleophilia bacterium]|jgi:hypothetical protein|nr:hypothetical protein [Thermoleophilia bacterium]
MSDEQAEADTGPWIVRHFDVLIAVLLGIAAILTAFAAYRASLDDGDALKNYSTSTRLAADSSQMWTQGNQIEVYNQSLFLDYAVAAAKNDTEVAAYIRTALMDADLQKAIVWWEKQPDSGPATPFVAENPAYVNASYTEGQRLDEASRAAFEEGARLDDRGDKYTLATVTLAVSLFLLGLAAIFRRFAIKAGVAAMGSVALVVAVVQIGQAM